MADAEAVIAEKTITKRIKNLIEEYRNVDETTRLMDRLDLLKKMNALRGVVEEWAECLAFRNSAKFFKPNNHGGNVMRKTMMKRKTKKKSNKKKRKAGQSFKR